MKYSRKGKKGINRDFFRVRGKKAAGEESKGWQ